MSTLLQGTDAQADELQAWVNYTKALVDLDQTTGMTLEIDMTLGQAGATATERKRVARTSLSHE